MAGVALTGAVGLMAEDAATATAAAAAEVAPAVAPAVAAAPAAAASAINSGDTTWVLVSTALVMLMTRWLQSRRVH